MTEFDRTQGIGGSTIPKIAGLSPFGGPLDVFLELTHRAPPRKAAGSGARKWGNRLESLVLYQYEEQIGRPLRLNRDENGEQRVFWHKSVKFAYCHPDAWHEDSPQLTLAEAKTSAGENAHKWGAEGTHEIPEDYSAQTQWQMEVMDAADCAVPVLFDGRDFRVYHVVRDREFGEALLEIGARFMRDYVQNDVAPDPKDWEERLALAEGLRRGRNINGVMPSTPHIDELALMLREHRQAQAFSDSFEGELRAQILTAMGNAESVVGDWGRIDHKQPRDTSTVDWRAVAEHLLASLPAAQRLELLQRHTSLRENGRRFVPRFK